MREVEKIVCGLISVPFLLHVAKKKKGSLSQTSEEEKNVRWSVRGSNSRPRRSHWIIDPGVSAPRSAD